MTSNELLAYIVKHWRNICVIHYNSLFVTCTITLIVVIVVKMSAVIIVVMLLVLVIDACIKLHETCTRHAAFTRVWDLAFVLSSCASVRSKEGRGKQ